jgi:hypothetical protein
MSRVFHNGLTKIILLTIIFAFYLNQGLSFGIPNNKMFEIEFVGYSNKGFIPGPCPPGILCTYDYMGWWNIVLGIKYLGDSSITVTNIQVIQTLHVSGSYWNKSNSNQIISQNITISSGETYYFLAEGIYTLSVGDGIVFPLHVRITDADENIYWLYQDPPESHNAVTDTEYLSMLPFISQQGAPSGINFLFLFSLFIVVKMKRRKKKDS